MRTEIKANICKILIALFFIQIENMQFILQSNEILVNLTWFLLLVIP